MPGEHRPDDAVIDDDEALDAWWKQFCRDQDRKAGRKGDSRLSLLPGPANDPAAHVPTWGGATGG
jgi:hypothetical protein